MTDTTSFVPDALATAMAANETQAAIDAGVALAEPSTITDGLVGVIIPAGGTFKEVDLKAFEDKHAAHPRRKVGTVHVQDADSFVAYLDKHGLHSSEVFADPARRGLVGIINAHAGTTDAPGSDTMTGRVEADAGHGDHRVLLELIATDAWTAWTKNDKQWMSQVQFAEHLEDNILDIVNPDAATMLEIAQSFHATTGVAFKSVQRLHSGEATLKYEETTTARAGQKGDLDIPTEFTLYVQPFTGQPTMAEITARFRYRIRDGVLSLSYALNQPDVVVRQVFDEIVETVREGITQPVFQGRPA